MTTPFSYAQAASKASAVAQPPAPAPAAPASVAAPSTTTISTAQEPSGVQSHASTSTSRAESVCAEPATTNPTDATQPEEATAPKSASEHSAAPESQNADVIAVTAAAVAEHINKDKAEPAKADDETTSTSSVPTRPSPPNGAHPSGHGPGAGGRSHDGRRARRGRKPREHRDSNKDSKDPKDGAKAAQSEKEEKPVEPPVELTPAVPPAVNPWHKKGTASALAPANGSTTGPGKAAEAKTVPEGAAAPKNVTKAGDNNSNANGDSHPRRGAPRGNRSADKEEKKSFSSAPPPPANADHSSWPTLANGEQLPPQSQLLQQPQQQHEHHANDEAVVAAAAAAGCGKKKQWKKMELEHSTVYQQPAVGGRRGGRGGSRGGRDSGGRGGSGPLSNGDRSSHTNATGSAPKHSEGKPKGREGREGSTRDGPANLGGSGSGSGPSPGSVPGAMASSSSSKPMPPTQAPKRTHQADGEEGAAQKQSLAAAKDGAEHPQHQQTSGRHHSNRREHRPSESQPSSEKSHPTNYVNSKSHHGGSHHRDGAREHPQNGRERENSRNDRGGRGGSYRWNRGSHNGGSHGHTNSQPFNHQGHAAFGQPGSARQGPGPFSPTGAPPNGSFAPSAPGQGRGGNRNRGYGRGNAVAAGAVNGASRSMPPHIQTDINQPGFMQPHSAPAYMPYPNATPDDNTVMDALRRQIEYYFDNQNLVKDMWLRKNMDSNGMVLLSVIMGFSRVRTFRATIDQVRSVIAFSVKVDLMQSPDGKDRLRARQDWDRWVLAPEDRFQDAKEECVSFWPTPKHPIAGWLAVNGPPPAYPMQYPPQSAMDPYPQHNFDHQIQYPVRNMMPNQGYGHALGQGQPNGSHSQLTAEAPEFAPSNGMFNGYNANASWNGQNGGGIAHGENGGPDTTHPGPAPEQAQPATVEQQSN